MRKYIEKMAVSILGKVRKQIKKLEKDNNNGRVSNSEYRFQMRQLRKKERELLNKDDNDKHGKKVSYLLLILIP